MPTTYKGLTVPLSSDLADGPAAFRDYTDSLPNGDSIEAITPPGAIMFTVATAAPTGWLFLDGSTVTNAQTLYPALWGVVPVAWRSGSNLLLPDCRGRFPITLNPADPLMDTMGDTGGSLSKSVTIAGGNLPPHTHTQTGTHLSGGATARHYHGAAAGGQFVETFFGTSIGAPAGGTGAQGGTWTGNDLVEHQHWTTIAGETGNGPGSASAIAVDITPPFVAFNLMIRAA